MSYSWAKLWIEMLDDRKTASLPDSSWRRFVECILLAAEVNNDGILPNVPDMAWRLRVTPETMADDMTRLALNGLVELVGDGIWKVTNFTKRQSFIPVNQRVANHRERAKKAKQATESNADATPPQRDSNEHVTGRYTDKTRLDKTRLDEMEMEIGAPAQPQPPSRAPKPQPTMTANLHPAIKAIQQVTTYWPGEITHSVIIEKFGNNPDIKALERAYQLWISRGYNPRNFDGLGEWYQELVRDPGWAPPTPHKNGNTPPKDTGIKPMKEVRPGVY